MAVFLGPLVLTHRWKPPGADATTQQTIAYYALCFLFYYCNYFVIIFFNAGLVSYVVMKMNGGTPTVGDGLRAALERWPLIAGWALIAATVGFLLKIIEDRSDKIGQIVASILGGAWALITFLVVPILVVEQKGPFSALKESTLLLKKTWGENIIMNFSFSAIMFLLMIPAIAVIILATMAHNVVVLEVCVAGVIAYFVLLALVQSALEAVFQTAIYTYARINQVSTGFDESDLKSTITRR